MPPLPVKDESAIGLEKTTRDEADRKTCVDPTQPLSQKEDVLSEQIQIDELPLDSTINGLSKTETSNGNTVDHSEGVTMSTKQERVYLATLCWTIFLIGWNSGTLGPLLPTIQNYYHVRLQGLHLPTQELSPVDAFLYLWQCRLTIRLYQCFSSHRAA